MLDEWIQTDISIETVIILHTSKYAWLQHHKERYISNYLYLFNKKMFINHFFSLFIIEHTYSSPFWQLNKQLLQRSRNDETNVLCMMENATSLWRRVDDNNNNNNCDSDDNDEYQFVFSNIYYNLHIEWISQNDQTVRHQQMYLYISSIKHSASRRDS